MEMKLLAVAVSALFMASSALAAVEGESSIVTFTGSIVEETCSLDSKNLEVTMGDVSVNTFDGMYGTTTNKPFTIALNCGENAGDKSATITFTGDSASQSLGHTALVTGNTDVGVQILQGAELLKIDGSATSTPFPLTVSSSNSLDFAARYVALNATVNTGSANATANFTVHYE